MSKTIIIAEAGINHNGSFSVARSMIDKAKQFKADYIKFQTYRPELLVVRNSKLAKYQKKNTNFLNQYEMLNKYNLSEKDTLKLYKYAKQKKIGFLSTAFDMESAKFLLKFNMDFAKIPSGEITNFPLINFLSKKYDKIILSTGMSSLKEIEWAIKIIKKNNVKNKNIFIMHCTSSYPAQSNELNLNFLETLKKKFNVNVGYSDHTTSKIVPILAVAKGASIIEKHFTLNKNLKGPDHKSSILPKEFKEIISNISKSHICLGKKNKIISSDELKNKKIARKSIYAKQNIKIGDKFTVDNIITLRPDKGISANNWSLLIGKKSKYNFIKNDLIKIK